ncbi:hypothetical protein TNCV_3728461 [Trichonephila clavipes]|nr:hypothetical protein TNCV_3728461 [Trichonephila clavipes]
MWVNSRPYGFFWELMEKSTNVAIYDASGFFREKSVRSTNKERLAETGRRAPSLLVWLVEGEERWESPGHPQDFLPLNWGGTEPNRTVTCMQNIEEYPPESHVKNYTSYHYKNTVEDLGFTVVYCKQVQNVTMFPSDEIYASK